MDSYVQNTLQINEEVRFEPKRHWAVYVDIYFNLTVLYIIFCQFINTFISHTPAFVSFFENSLRMIGVVLITRLIYLFIRNYSIEMAVTNYRVVFKIGILNIYTEELSNEKIESVSVRQSILGRLLNYGDILFSGTGTSKLIFKKIYAPWWVKARAEDIIRESLANMPRQNLYAQTENFS